MNMSIYNTYIYIYVHIIKTLSPIYCTGPSEQRQGLFFCLRFRGESSLGNGRMANNMASASASQVSTVAIIGRWGLLIFNQLKER